MIQGLITACFRNPGEGGGEINLSAFKIHLHLTPLMTLCPSVKRKVWGLDRLPAAARQALEQQVVVRHCCFLFLSAAASLLPHRFVTVRRGSPAAKSGQIRPGDRLEAVEGRSVVTLPHRELAQILRRAGNTLRLTIIPRPSTCRHRHQHPAKNCTIQMLVPT